MKLPYPRNAGPIVEARAHGMKPAGLLIVVMTPRYEQLPNDAHVFIDAGQRYRWDWARGLENVIVAIDASTKLGTLLEDLEDAKVDQIDVVDVERRLGWMVCFANPLRTVRWPRKQTEDWLGDGEWHADLAQVKADYAALPKTQWRYAQ